jgi:hypothetical protein
VRLTQEPQVEASSPHSQREAPDDLEHRIPPNSQSPEPGVRVSIYGSILLESTDRTSQRQNTVTIEEIEESDGHASDTNPGGDRPQDSPESALLQPPEDGRTLEHDDKPGKGPDALVVEPEAASETPAPDGDRSLGS